MIRNNLKGRYVKETTQHHYFWEAIYELSYELCYGCMAILQELVIYVTLPGVSSVSAVQLDVSRNDISVIVPDKFKLNSAPLPFAVDSDKGRAKFDKAKGRLEVVLPVIPPPLMSPPPAFQPAALVEELPEEEAVDARDGEDANEASASSEQGPSGSPQEYGRDVEASRLPTDPEAKTENQKKWEEMHEASEQDTTQKLNEEAPLVASNPSSSDMSLKEPRPQQPIKLKPRLNSNIAEELD